jgi:hypothetical protein
MSRTQEYIETILGECIPNNQDDPWLLESRGQWEL